MEHYFITTNDPQYQEMSTLMQCIVQDFCSLSYIATAAECDYIGHWDNIVRLPLLILARMYEA